MQQATEKPISLSLADAALIRRALLIGLESLAEIEILENRALLQLSAPR